MNTNFNSRLRFHPMKSAVVLLVLTTVFCLPARAAKSEVFVLATLYKRHESIAAYDLEALRRIILAVKPDAVVLDVTPDELKQEKVHASKIEYPNVIFPLVKSEKYLAYAAEPTEPLFSEIVQSVGKGFQDFDKNNPDGAKALKQFNTGIFETLGFYWQTPADVNSQVTDKVFAGKEALRGDFVKEYGSGQQRWNQHTTDAVLRAAKENPRKRILVLLGIENCYWVRDALRSNKKINLIDMEQWLRTNLN